MPKIVRARAVNVSDDVLKIGDVAPDRPAKPRQKPKTTNVDGEEVLVLEDEGPKGPAAGEDAGQDDFEPAFDMTDEEGGYESPVRSDVIQGAMAEATHILEDALKRAEDERAEVLARAQVEAEELKRQADADGRREGYESIVGAVQETASGLEDAVAQFEGQRAGFEVEFEEQLKWMAAEIAGKVLAKKVEEDDAIMVEMVDKAVQGLRNEQWIRVEVAQQMVHLIDRLTELYEHRGDVSVSPIPAEPGTVQLETASGLVDVSVKTQLENLKDYFTRNGV